MQPSPGGTKPGLFREIMETGMSLDHSEDRGSGQGAVVRPHQGELDSG